MKPAYRRLVSPFLLCAAFRFSLLLPPQTQDNTARISQLVAEADICTEKNFDYEKALAKYQEALSLDSTNYETLWKISRSYVLIGEQLPALTDEQKERQLQTYEEAASFANRGIALNPNGAMGYVQRAAANSLVARFKNIWKSSSLMNDVKEDCEKAIELDSRNAAADHLLGRAHFKLSERTKLFRWPFGVGWGNRDDAIQYFEKAIAIQPNYITYRIDAARAYVDNKDYEKAREHLSVISTLPTLSKDDDRLRKDASDLFEQIKNK